MLHAVAPQRSEKGAGSPEPAVTDSCELAALWVLGAVTASSGRAVSALTGEPSLRPLREAEINKSERAMDCCSTAQACSSSGSQMPSCLKYSSVSTRCYVISHDYCTVPFNNILLHCAF